MSVDNPLNGLDVSYLALIATTMSGAAFVFGWGRFKFGSFQSIYNLCCAVIGGLMALLLSGDRGPVWTVCTLAWGLLLLVGALVALIQHQQDMMHLMYPPSSLVAVGAFVLAGAIFCDVWLQSTSPNSVISWINVGALWAVTGIILALPVALLHAAIMARRKAKQRREDEHYQPKLDIVHHW